MAKKATRRRVAHRKKLQNRFSMVLVTLVVVVLLVVVGVRSYALTQKREVLLEQMAEIEKQQEQENIRAQEIEEYGKYTQTLKFYEEMAKKKLGLVYEDEIIFIQED